MVTESGGPGDQSAMLQPTTSRLAMMHRNQVRRGDWPAFDTFEPSLYDGALRREAAVQWAGRARAEHGSIHQFTQVAHALATARVELELLGGLARLVTDEVRHAELCSRMAYACLANDVPSPGTFAWPRPKAPWPDPPPPSADPEPTLAWAARAIAAACCIGETLSRPMLDAIALVTTDPVATAVTKQILRDEHLHAAFGWESLGLLLPRLSGESRDELDAYVSAALGGVEETTACGIAVEDVVGREITIAVTGRPNLGTLSDEQYAMIFYATIEREVLPGFAALGLDAERAWAER